MNKILLLMIALLSFTSAQAKNSVRKSSRKAEVAALLSASQDGDLKKVKQLAGKVDLNAQGAQKLTALMEAAVTGQEVVVDFLLGKKVDLELKNENGDTALAMAVGNEQNAIAEKLIRAGAHVDVTCGENGETLLMCATRTNAIPLMKIILKKAPKELSKRSKEGKTAFDLAKEYGTPESLRLLQMKH